MIEPKEITITTDKGDRVYIISKFPAIAGREIVMKYPLTGMPKFGEYQANEETMLKLMSYVAIPKDGGGNLKLTTRALIDNHIDSWETLGKLEIAMLEYNCSFFRDGRVSNFLKDFAQKIPPLIIKILTSLSQSSFPKEKPRSKN